MVTSNKISGGNRKIFQFVYLSILSVCLAGLFSEAGCSTVTSVKKPVPEKTWTCDKTADNAMKREDYEAAIVLHQRLLDKDASNALALYHLGYAHGQLGAHDKEVYYYEKAIALGFKQQGIFFNLGMAYGELNQTENSIRALRKAVDSDPGNADYHFGLALSYQRSLADRLAEAEFLKAITIDPKHVDARLYLSLLYADKGELQKAAEQLREILEIDPTHTDARQFLERIERQ
jgi:tetratricopeptide (TPR) repeat protein